MTGATMTAVTDAGAAIGGVTAAAVCDAGASISNWWSRAKAAVVGKTSSPMLSSPTSASVMNGSANVGGIVDAAAAMSGGEVEKVAGYAAAGPRATNEGPDVTEDVPGGAVPVPSATK